MSSRTPFPAYGGGRTPAPAWSGGRTPAPQAGGGATPAYGAKGNGSGAAWDPSGRTPAYQPNAPSESDCESIRRSLQLTRQNSLADRAAGGGAWAPDSRTPLHRTTNDSWNPSSRTPAYPSSRTPAHPSSVASDPWSASSRTPFHPSLAAVRGANNGGRTPDPRAGARTPAYGGKAGGYGGGYGSKQEDRGEGGSGMAQAPTPAAGLGADDDGWGADSAPTPAAAVSLLVLDPTELLADKLHASQKSHDYGGPQAKTPYEAPTPYAGAPTPAAGAPTPAAYNSNYGGGAPTPAAYGAAPTPGAYPSGPTPGAYHAVATPGGYPAYQTPGTYAGAATAAAMPLEYQERSGDSGTGLPKDWVEVGVRVIFAQSEFQNNRLVGQYGELDDLALVTCGIRADLGLDVEQVSSSRPRISSRR